MSVVPAPKLDLDNTFGALYIGVMVAGLLHGVSCVQAWCYFIQQRDAWPLKTVVASVMIFDTIHQVLITHAAYVYLIKNYANPIFLGTLTESILVEILFNGFTAFVVQSFLTMRVYVLSGRNLLLTGIATGLLLAEFAAITAFYAIVQNFKTFAQLAQVKTLSIAVNALAAATDVFIAVTLCIILHRSRTGFQRSDTMINKLIIFAVNTGALTSLCALASLVSITAAPNTFIYIAFFFCLGRLYSNSLLATLNARSMIRNSMDTLHNSHHSSHSGTRKGSSNSGGGGTLTAASAMRFRIANALEGDLAECDQRVPTNISIKIDTTKEYVSDNDQSSDRKGDVELHALPV